MKFGAHMPAGGGWWRALERGSSIGCEVVQLFLKNCRQWAGRSPRPEEIRRFSQARSDGRFHCVFGHAGYLINLAGPSSSQRDRSISSLIVELELAAALEIPFLVLHPGAHLGQGESAGLGQAIRGLDEAIRATSGSPVRVALENTAGQGTCLGAPLTHLAAIFEGVESPRRLGVCLDTAHCFAAGHDLRSPRGWSALLDEIDRRIGLQQLLALHLNDSRAGLGSRVDRHAGIGEGKIGAAAFRHIVRDPRLRNHPGCLETPKSADLHEDVVNLARLRRLARPDGSSCRRRPSSSGIVR
ncbi:MAG TPA: deoxyribonuclease IV [Candidatus Paceibacterota bacterium]|nr:deoxyribonuclease IV [Verrucomicrobiota bacterium]HRZ45172.1 deoxyribonuclease IV [Candidatus Paceibacterota bacterium]HRZ91502.1 deoxyribonuclease IV [Candidatus Paceibacterota bacterium]